MIVGSWMLLGTSQLGFTLAGFALTVTGAALIFVGRRRQRGDTSASPTGLQGSPAPVTAAERRRPFFMLVPVLCATAVASPFFLSWQDPTVDFRLAAIISAVSLPLALAIAYWAICVKAK